MDQRLQEIAAGDFSRHVAVANRDELGTLATNLNRMNDELKVLYEELEAANRHKSRFLASVSHELRTPLNAIIGFSRLILRKTEGQIPDLQRANLQKVLISGEHLLTLINGLLDLSKIEAGKMEVLPEAVELAEVLDGAASTVEPMLTSGQVRLIREVAPDVPLLYTDREKLRQILLNLLSNAAKFTEHGEIRVLAWRENGWLKLAVADSGIGMESEALSHIFEEFRQVGSSSTLRSRGTGLGLAITRQLVSLLGGDISVHSDVGKGSTFTVVLPIRFNGSKTRG
jgi:signal transduction histidine kinase